MKNRDQGFNTGKIFTQPGNRFSMARREDKIRKGPDLGTEIKTLTIDITLKRKIKLQKMKVPSDDFVNT